MNNLRSAHLIGHESADLTRIRWVLSGLGIFLLLLITRLGYWQIIKAPQLQAEAQEQYQRTIKTIGKRGGIYTVDGYALVTNTVRYRLTAHPYQLEQSPGEVAQQLVPLLVSTADTASSSNSARPSAAVLTTKFLEQLSKDAKWVPLLSDVSETEKQAIQSLKLSGVDFEKYYQRVYPEASMAAHITGFVGKNSQGEEQGYFGVEGALDKELRGRDQQQSFQADALGGRFAQLTKPTSISSDGRDVVLTIHRDIQKLVETQLQAAVEKYGAKSGEIVVMEPSTGKILALATWPTYEASHYQSFSGEIFKNTAVSSLFEPGSTFKTLTVAAGIDAGVIGPETTCPNCAGPVNINQYSIKTWNNQYNPDISMKDALAKSDNTAMVYVAQLLGNDRFKKYIEDFGIAEKSQIELQEDTKAPFPTKWGPVELATRAFGQGISTSTLQMTKAIAAIANQGALMKPIIVEKVIDPATNQEIVTEPQIERQVISPQTAQTVTQMMMHSAAHGEAQWTDSADHWVAGKTGTSQIAEDGGYVADKTIATFVGFAPPEKPKFIMFVKLVEPTSSIWAAETAAPLWYKIADKLYLLLNIPPDKQLSPS